MKRKKRFVLGDCHGNYKGLLQCIKRSGISYDDKLICLGDTCDGYPDVKECFYELMRFKNLIHIMGNHDYWAYEWFVLGKEIGIPKSIWTSQGGTATIKSFKHKMPKKIVDLLNDAPYYYIEDNCLFVHGGINHNQKNMEKQDKELLMWDRDLIESAKIKHYKKPNFKWGDFDRIYTGHTTTELYGTTDPLQYCNVIMLDTGGGWSGKLTIMDIDTCEFWQSDLATDLYSDNEREK